MPGTRRKSATLHHVAERAGVSIMTVSRVFNDTARVSATTRERVERAIRELRYVPNQFAKALVTSQKPREVAFLFDTPNAAVLGEMVSTGFKEAAATHIRLLFIRARPEDDPREIIDNIKDLDVRGVILAPPLSDDSRLRLALRNAGVRVVAIGCGDPDPSLSTIGIDDERAAREVTDYLIRIGHQRIGFIAGHPRHRSSARRRRGYEAALVDAGIAVDRALQWEGHYTFGSALAAAEQALSLNPRPTAVFASNDDMAAAVISVARGRGIAVPRSLSVVGFDDSEIAAMMFPQLTTVRVPTDEMVSFGVRQLAAELAALDRGEDPPVTKLLLDHVIVYRDSDAPPEEAQAPRHARAAE